MSRVLADTHAVLWWLGDDPELAEGARGVIADPANEPLVSDASVWEIAIKRSPGKLTAPADLPAQIAAHGFGWLPVMPEHAWEARELPPHHGDPFDRIQAAQSLVERIPIVTRDSRFAGHGVEVRWS